MDNITHTLTGAVLSRAGLNRVSPHAMAILLAAANAPDLDVLLGFGGMGTYLRYHRGPLHSLIAMPLLALLVTALMRLFVRRPFPWWPSYFVALAGVASNPIFDLANTYGVRLLWPFSNNWINFDLISIIDPWILLVLVMALALPWMLGLVSSEIGARGGSGRGIAVLALCLIAVYGFGRYLLHSRAVAILDTRIYQGQVPLRVGAFPTAWNPLRWTGVVEGRDFYQKLPGLNPLGEFDPMAGTIYYKPDPRPELVKARATGPFMAMREFAQWPLWRVSPAPDPENGVLVDLIDLRFGDPAGSHMAATALFDASGNLLKARMR
jgi:inner membrane protein